MTFAPDLDFSSDRWLAGRFLDGSRAMPCDAPWRRTLRTVVASRIVPHLLARQRYDHSTFSPERIAAFATLLLSASLGVVAGVVEDALGDGATLEAVFLEFLAPAARQLGDLWLADRLSFLDVTRGSAMLQAVLRMFAPAFESQGATPTDRSILLLPVPGEQHVFGLSMLSVFFRRAGWRVVLEPAIDADEAEARLAAESFDAVGVSAAGDKFAANLPRFVERLRGASANRSLSVLAGGPAFLADPDLADAVGADAVAGDAPAAVATAEALVGARLLRA